VDRDKLKKVLERFPFALLLALVVIYYVFDVYQYETDTASPVGQMKENIKNISLHNQKIKKEIEETKRFYAEIESKKVEVRELARELAETKVVLSDAKNTPSFIKMVVTEARKVGLKVISIRPKEQKVYEYYTEQSYELSFRGVFVQMLIFLERLSSLQDIVRVDDFDLKTVGIGVSKYVQLHGKIDIKTYLYKGSKADELGSENAGGFSGAVGAPVNQETR